MKDGFDVECFDMVRAHSEVPIWDGECSLFSVEISMAALKGSDGCKPQAMEGYATCFSMENLNQIDEQMRLSSSFLSAKLLCVFPQKKTFLVKVSARSFLFFY